MGQNAPTLKDIAERLGLSIGTVAARAAQPRAAYSPQTQQRVLEEAKRCGYTVNVMASALRRPPINLAAVFPEPVGENRYFFRYVWEGIEKACEELVGVQHPRRPLLRRYERARRAGGAAPAAARERAAGAGDERLERPAFFWRSWRRSRRKKCRCFW